MDSVLELEHANANLDISETIVLSWHVQKIVWDTRVLVMANVFSRGRSPFDPGVTSMSCRTASARKDTVARLVRWTPARTTVPVMENVLRESAIVTTASSERTVHLTCVPTIAVAMVTAL